MIKSSITIDLPGEETLRRKKPLEWIRSLFGAEIDLRSGKEEITISSYALMRGLVSAFEQAGISDVISLLVDHKVVYMDIDEIDRDLPSLDRAMHYSGVLDRPFREMHLVLSHRADGLHTIIDVRVTSQVVVGDSAMRVTLSSRLEALRIHTGETARAYEARVRAFTEDEAGIEGARQAVNALAGRLGDAFRATLGQVGVTIEPARIQLIRPEVAQLGRFRKLEFGAAARAPRYRPVPTRHRSGAYADPYYYYYYDPHYDLVSYWIVSRMSNDAVWHSPHVDVVDPAGNVLFTGDAVPEDALGAGADVVSFDEAGGLCVAESIPAFAGAADVVAAGATSWGDAGHEATAGGSANDAAGAWSASEAGAWSASDVDTSRISSGGGFFSSLFGGSSCSSSSDSGSSCGSSCSGSSCGSSCGSF